MDVFSSISRSNLHGKVFQNAPLGFNSRSRICCFSREDLGLALTEVVFRSNNTYSSSVGRVIGVKATGGIRKPLLLFLLDPLQTYPKLFKYQSGAWVMLTLESVHWLSLSLPIRVLTRKTWRKRKVMQTWRRQQMNQTLMIISKEGSSKSMCYILLC